jgi:hypothetical protein
MPVARVIIWMRGEIQRVEHIYAVPLVVIIQQGHLTLLQLLVATVLVHQFIQHWGLFIIFSLMV